MTNEEFETLPNEEEEDEAIIGVLSIGKQEFPGRIYLTSENQVVISVDLPDANIMKKTVINPIGLLETNIVPHASTLDFGPEVNIEADDMPASLLITYLQNLFDNSSYKTICFNTIRWQLVEFNKKINEISSSLKSKLLFEGPNLTPSIESGQSTLKRVVRKKTENASIHIPFELINGPSGILNEGQIDIIRLAIPLRFRKLSWTKLYDMQKDGVALSTLYSKAKSLMPLILLVETNESAKIGAFLSCGLKVVRGYSGTGETFVFRFTPDIEIFKWSRQNDLFVAAGTEDIAIGGGGGTAIFLNSSLEKGISEFCETFSSPMLTKQQEFKVVNVELWNIKSNFVQNS